MRNLGRGNFGKVKLVYDTEDGNKQYAMKVIKKKRKIKGYGKGPGEIEEIQNEIAIMKKLVRSCFCLLI
jgi:serine/threonine protein kinase